MVEFSKQTIDTINEKLTKSGVAVDFAVLVNSILGELSGTSTVKAEPKYNKFMAGSVNISKDKIVACEIKTVKGTAIWDNHNLIKDKDVVTAMFKLEGKKGLYSFTMPNPGVADKTAHDWCMATFVDLAAALVVKRGA